MENQNWQHIQIESLGKLYQHEKEILSRIRKTVNGGYLFTLHPLMLLEEVGVHLSEQATEELLKLEPRIKASSQRAYKAVQNSEAKQPVRVTLKRLFRREA